MAKLDTGIETKFSNIDVGYRTSFSLNNALNPPANVTASDGTYTDKVVITWNELLGAEKYYIYRSTESETGYTKIGETTQTAYEDTTASTDTTYHYKVSAYSEEKGESEMSQSNSGYCGSEDTIALGNWISKSIASSGTKWYWFDGLAGESYKVY